METFKINRKLNEAQTENVKQEKKGGNKRKKGRRGVTKKKTFEYQRKKEETDNKERLTQKETVKQYSFHNSNKPATELNSESVDGISKTRKPVTKT